MYKIVSLQGLLSKINDYLFPYNYSKEDEWCGESNESSSVDVEGGNVFTMLSSEHSERWFKTLEEHFDRCNITGDNSRFCTLANMIAPEDRATPALREIIVNPPDRRKYKTLKNAALKLMHRQMLEKTGQEQGMPSEVLAKMRARACEETDEELRSMWLNALPTRIQPMVRAVHTFHGLDELAKTADTVQEITSGFYM